METMWSIYLPKHMKIGGHKGAVECVDSKDIFYIGGTDVLPPALEAEKENEMIMWLGTENEEKARKTLEYYNLEVK